MFQRCSSASGYIRQAEANFARVGARIDKAAALSGPRPARLAGQGGGARTFAAAADHAPGGSDLARGFSIIPRTSRGTGAEDEGALGAAAQASGDTGAAHGSAIGPRKDGAGGAVAQALGSSGGAHGLATGPRIPDETGTGHGAAGSAAARAPGGRGAARGFAIGPRAPRDTGAGDEGFGGRAPPAAVVGRTSSQHPWSSTWRQEVEAGQHAFLAKGLSSGLLEEKSNVGSTPLFSPGAPRPDSGARRLGTHTPEANRCAGTLAELEEALRDVSARQAEAKEQMDVQLQTLMGLDRKVKSFDGRLRSAMAAAATVAETAGDVAMRVSNQAVAEASSAAEKAEAAAAATATARQEVEAYVAEFQRRLENAFGPHPAVISHQVAELHRRIAAVSDTVRRDHLASKSDLQKAMEGFEKKLRRSLQRQLEALDQELRAREERQADQLGAEMNRRAEVASRIVASDLLCGAVGEMVEHCVREAELGQ